MRLANVKPRNGGAPSVTWMNPPVRWTWLGWKRLELCGVSSTASIWISECLLLLALSIVAPFYVAGGFALYLTRRTELEAWDIEISFRRIRDQHLAETSGVRQRAVVPTLVLAVSIFMLQPIDLLAVEHENRSTSRRCCSGLVARCSTTRPDGAMCCASYRQS